MTAPAADLADRCRSLARSVADARLAVSSLTGAERAALLRDVASSIRSDATAILEANRADLDRGDSLSPALLDRLRLDDDRLDAVARAVENIADQPDPVGRVVDGRVLPSGVRLEKRRVPLGVVLIIYESRPNVTADAAALCLKAGNGVLLRGGKEARQSNLALAAAIRRPLADRGLADAVAYVDIQDRAAVNELLRLTGLIDLVVPRGGPGLIRAVSETSLIPVVKHDAGNCHLYIDAHLDGLRETAIDIALNAKTHRPGVCNAIETLLVHADVAADLLAPLAEALEAAGVEIRAGDRARDLMPNAAPATDDDWRAEYLDLILAVRVVDSLDDACEHIRRYGSHHTDAIVTSSIASAQRFVALVDSASVMVNCSTRFADGGEYGLGAEIGISTDKLHARGPMGAEDLTTFQWVLTGQGQIRT